MSLDPHDGSLVYEIPADKFKVKYNETSAPCYILLLNVLHFLHLFTFV